MAHSESPAPAAPEALPSMAYRAWFLLVMVLVSASVLAERYMMSVMVEPVRRDLGLSDFEIGLVKDLAITAVYVLAVIPVARLADRHSKRKIVAAAAVIWGGAVMICGLAKNFWILLIGRAGIGLGEGSFTPPSQAWIADLFPPRQRATAMAIFLLGASLGMLLGPALGGWAAAEVGWRNAMLLAGIPSLILAPLVWFTLRDPRPGLADGFVGDKPQAAPLSTTLRELAAIRTLPMLIAAAALNTVMTAGLVGWIPAFMERTHGIPASVSGLQMGGALFLGSTIGHTVGGPLSDLLGRRDKRWYIWIMMLSGACATVLGYVILSGSSDAVFPLLGLQLLIGGMSAAPMMWTVTTLAPIHSRATAVGVLMVTVYLIGMGLGPVLIGALSDLLEPVYGAESLGVAMKWSLLVGIPSTLLAWIGARACKGDFAAAAERLEKDGGTAAAPVVMAH